MTDPSSGDGAAQPASLSTPPGDRVGIAIVGLGGAVATTARGRRRAHAGRRGGDRRAPARGPGARADGGARALRAPRVRGVGPLRRRPRGSRASPQRARPWAVRRGQGRARPDHAVAGVRRRPLLPRRGPASTATRPTSACAPSWTSCARTSATSRARTASTGPSSSTLASTESTPDLSADVFQTAEAFEAAIDADDDRIPPAMLYATAAILEGVPYGNFTPSVGADVPALVALAEAHGVPLAGKDGKTGQTFLKTLMAPGLRDRALRVEGWFSTNILGNRDGEALPRGRLAGVQDRDQGDRPRPDPRLPGRGPRGQDQLLPPARRREGGVGTTSTSSASWGSGCRSRSTSCARTRSLAAPLVLDIARCLDLASRAGRGGVAEADGGLFQRGR